MSWLFDLFVAPGVSAAEIAEMDAEMAAQQVGELREADIAPEMTDVEIAEAIIEFAQEQ